MVFKIFVPQTWPRRQNKRKVNLTIIINNVPPDQFISYVGLSIPSKTITIVIILNKGPTSYWSVIVFTTMIIVFAMIMKPGN